MSQPSTESSHLLQQPVVNEPSQAEHRQRRSSTFSCKHFCLPSKAAILIILWTAAVGAVYNLVLLVAAGTMITTNPLYSDISTVNDYLPYAILAFVTMLYPLSGFIADVYCGRLRVAVISLNFILTFTLLLCSLEIIGFATNALAFRNYSAMVHVVFHNAKGITLLTLILVSLIAFIIARQT